MPSAQNGGTPVVGLPIRVCVDNRSGWNTESTKSVAEDRTAAKRGADRRLRRRSRRLDLVELDSPVAETACAGSHAAELATSRWSASPNLGGHRL